eukprot:Skav211081  [mRNA]  locus=scaffold314:332311:333030:+ [translate_table: standard]
MPLFLHVNGNVSPEAWSRGEYHLEFLAQAPRQPNRQWALPDHITIFEPLLLLMKVSILQCLAIFGPSLHQVAAPLWESRSCLVHGNTRQSPAREQRPGSPEFAEASLVTGSGSFALAVARHEEITGAAKTAKGISGKSSAKRDPSVQICTEDLPIEFNPTSASALMMSKRWRPSAASFPTLESTKHQLESFENSEDCLSWAKDIQAEVAVSVSQAEKETGVPVKPARTVRVDSCSAEQS